MAALVHSHLRLKNVRLGLGDGLKSISHENGQLAVNLQSGKVALADMVILSIGVKPESSLANVSGLDLGPRGHIVVNDSLQTSDNDIYAIGDVIQVTSPITNTPTAIPLAGPANRQGRLAANHIMGRPTSYQGTQGTAIAKIFDLIVAITGATSRQLQQNNLAFRATITRSPDHATYYPGASDMSIKLLYAADDGRLLGAQIVGTKGIDRTIGILATAIKAHMTIFDLEHLELAYAPPLGSIRDPVNVAGFVAANWLRGDTDIVHWNEIAHLDPEKESVLDVRTSLEHELGHIDKAVHIPVEELRERLGELSKDKHWVLYCKEGRRAYIAERILKQNGFQASNLTGGWDLYEPATGKQANFDEWQKASSPAKSAGLQQLSAPSVGRVNEEATTFELDACGLQCPGPILAVFREMQKMETNQVLKVTATDPGFARDIAAWSDRTGNKLIDLKQEGSILTAVIRKQDEPDQSAMAVTGTRPSAKTMVVFSADLDRALASFIIANGAAAMNQQVTMFFTFWGLNVLRKRDSVSLKKNLVEKMFGWMMPRGSTKLKLSQMHMAGAGTAMIKSVMKAKNIDPLPKLIKSAQENGVRLIACQMSMDLMGIKFKELIDGVEVGGVATFIAAADDANATLFI